MLHCYALCNQIRGKSHSLHCIQGKNTKYGLVKKEIHRRIGYPKDVELAVKDNDWFDEEVMLDWIDRVWKREVAVDPNEIYYLSLDSFTTHMTGPV
jgi:hypothetical protein